MLNRMLNNMISHKVMLLFPMFGCVIGVLSDESITIPLNKTLTPTNRELYSDFVQLNRSSTLKINLENPSKNLSFVIVQIHTHIYDVKFYNNSISNGSELYGRNLAMFSSVKALDTFFVFNNNSEADIKVLVAVFGYGIQDPIPGGCNMEFPIPIAPYLQTSYTNDTISVDAPSAKFHDDPKCLSTSGLTFYRIYLPSGDFSEETYFDGLKSMMSLDSIKEKGEILPMTGFMHNMRRLLAAYPGTGSIYAVVAFDGDIGYSVYAPVATYACDPSTKNCYFYGADVFTQAVSAGIFLVGLFMCYYGRRYFKTTLLFVGMTAGTIVSYIILKLVTNLDDSILGYSLLCGFGFGLLWYISWCCCQTSKYSAILHTMMLGFMVSCIMYYILPAGLPVLEKDYFFWSLFVSILLFISSVLFMLSHTQMVCCVILGGYAIIYPMDLYIGTNLNYFLINAIRRAVVPKFNWAIMSPPFGTNEALLATLWIGVSISGIIVQRMKSRTRPRYHSLYAFVRASFSQNPPPVFPPDQAAFSPERVPFLPNQPAFSRNSSLSQGQGAFSHLVAPDPPMNYGSLSRNASKTKLCDPKNSSRINQSGNFHTESTKDNERTPLIG